MRGLLKRIAEAIEAGDEQLALEIGDTLLMLVQQHDAREEGMLYPEAEALLAERWDDLLARLAQY